MTEKNLVINQKKIVYNGIFRTDELLSVIKQALQEKNYRYQEKKSEELVTAAGRVLQLELRPIKSVAQYVSLMIKIHLALDNITETTKEVSGVKQKFQQGDVFIAFDAWSLTDYEGRWGSKPLNFFLKGFIRKYLYKFPLEEGFTRQLVGDTAYVYGQIKNLLQSYQGKKIPPMKEEEVMKSIEEEMAK
ncbi:MAG: hypothetical protein AABY40_00705 [Nanoarchaeota archaeon]